MDFPIAQDEGATLLLKIKTLNENENVDINEFDAKTRRPIWHCAVHKPNVELLGALRLFPNWRVNDQDQDGNTALHIAATKFDTSLIQILLEAGADTSIVNNDGKRPLDTAIQQHTEGITTGGLVFATPLSSSIIPEDSHLLKNFCMDLSTSHTVFQDRCKEVIRQLIEEKHIALYKNQILEQSMGIKDRETSERFIDELKYWHGESEKQTATIAYLKIRISMMEVASKQQEEMYRKNIMDLTKDHNEQLQSILRRSEEAEKVFLEAQRAHSQESTELQRLREEVAILRGGTSGGQMGPNNPEWIRLKLEAASIMTEKAQIEERMNLAEKLKTLLQKENNDLRNEINRMRLQLEAERLQQVQKPSEVKYPNLTLPSASMDAPVTKSTGHLPPEKLVDRLLDPSTVDNQFMQAFLLTFKSFMTSRTLMDFIVKFYNETINAAPAQHGDQPYHPPRLLRIVNTLKFWIDTYWSDFQEDQSLISNINNLIETLREEKLKQILKNAVSRKLTGEGAVVIESSRQPPPPILPKNLTPSRSSSRLGMARSGSMEDLARIKFTDVDPLEMARQLTLLEVELFSSIKVREFLDLAWMKEDKHTLAPNLLRMVQWSNHVIHWVVSEIVSIKEGHKQRAQVMERMIALAQNLEKLNNFNGVKEVMAALQTSAVYRLKKTRELVGAKFLKGYEDLSKLVSSELNYKFLRQKVHSVTPPLIPFPGVYQGDLVFIDTCSKDSVTNGQINFSKYQKMAHCILELQSFQKTPFTLEPVVEIQMYIRTYQVLDDQAAYQSSLECEART